MTEIAQNIKRYPNPIRGEVSYILADLIRLYGRSNPDRFQSGRFPARRHYQNIATGRATITELHQVKNYIKGKK